MAPRSAYGSIDSSINNSINCLNNDETVVPVRFVFFSDAVSFIRGEEGPLAAHDS